MRGIATIPATRVIVALVALAGVLAVGRSAAAQDEGALRGYFEGKRVVVKLDMPGTSEGVDVWPDASRPIDFQKHGYRLKTYGIALHAGDSSTVTLLKLKKDLIEFQLGGGGFGTFSDDSSTSVYIPTATKTQREKDLEKWVKDEPDAYRRRQMKDELDQLRERRERENRRNEVMKTEAEERKKERVAEQRLRGGSRFNLHYQGGVPFGIKPQEVAAALAEYVDFGIDRPRTDRDELPTAPAMPVGGLVHKGMTRAEAERALGKPTESSVRKDGGLSVTVLVFVHGDDRVTAEFVEGVLIRYTIASN